MYLYLIGINALVNAHAVVFSEARGLEFDLSIHTQNFGYASGVGSGESEPSLLAEALGGNVHRILLQNEPRFTLN